MTHPSRNLRTHDSTSFDVRAIVWFAFLAWATLMSPANAPAEDQPLPSRSSAAEDRRIEVHVRKALAKDARLGSLNLGVRMTRGIAHLFGPVPSAEFLAQARQIVQQIPGVLDVRTSEIYFVQRREEGKALPLPLEDAKPTQTRSASPHQQSSAPSSLTAREVLASIPSKRTPFVRLLEPEAVTTSPRGPKPALLTGKIRTPTAEVTLTAALDQLRQRDSRFRSIRTEVRGTTVRIFTGASAGEKVMAFAQAVRRLPGVQRVVMQDHSFRSR